MDMKSYEDKRQQSIVFQNSMAHAVNILIHNSRGDPIKPEDVIDLAKRIAIVAINPQLEKKLEEIMKEKKNDTK